MEKLKIGKRYWFRGVRPNGRIRSGIYVGNVGGCLLLVEKDGTEWKMSPKDLYNKEAEVD